MGKISCWSLLEHLLWDGPFPHFARGTDVGFPAPPQDRGKAPTAGTSEGHRADAEAARVRGNTFPNYLESRLAWLGQFLGPGAQADGMDPDGGGCDPAVGSRTQRRTLRTINAYWMAQVTQTYRRALRSPRYGRAWIRER